MLIVPATVFSTSDMDQLRKILAHHWKERLKISKIAKFETDLLKTNEDIAPRQNREILQIDVCITCPHHTNVCKLKQLCGALYSFT